VLTATTEAIGVVMELDKGGDYHESNKYFTYHLSYRCCCLGN
jgi:hypothetical protein